MYICICIFVPTNAPCWVQLVLLTCVCLGLTAQDWINSQGPVPGEDWLSLSQQPLIVYSASSRCGPCEIFSIQTGMPTSVAIVQALFRWSYFLDFSVQLPVTYGRHSYEADIMVPGLLSFFCSPPSPFLDVSRVLCVEGLCISISQWWAGWAYSKSVTTASLYQLCTPSRKNIVPCLQIVAKVRSDSPSQCTESPN